MSSSVFVILRVNGGVQLISIAVRFVEISLMLEGAANNPALAIINTVTVVIIQHHDATIIHFIPCTIK